VRDVGAASAQPLREDGAGHPEVLEQHGDRSGFLDHRQVLTHDVLDQRKLKRPTCVERVVDQRRDRRLAGELRRAPPALAGDELILALGERSDDDRLQDPAFPDRVGKRDERCLLEALARLIGIRTDLPDRNLPQPVLSNVRVCGCGRSARGVAVTFAAAGESGSSIVSRRFRGALIGWPPPPCGRSAGRRRT
jgi:hypothetical protein